MIETPKDPTNPKACFHCGQPATKVPGYAALCDPCIKASDTSLPRDLTLLETLADIAAQHPSIRIGQILENVATTNNGLFYMSDSELHNRLRKFLRDNA